MDLFEPVGRKSVTTQHPDDVIRRVEALPARRVALAVILKVHLDRDSPVIPGHQRRFECRKDRDETAAGPKDPADFAKHHVDVGALLRKNRVDGEDRRHRFVRERQLTVVGENEGHAIRADAVTCRRQHRPAEIGADEREARDGQKVSEEKAHGTAAEIEDATGTDG